MSKINLDALNPQGRDKGGIEPSEPRSAEEYFRQELQRGMNGDPKKLLANHKRLEDEINKSVSTRLILSEQQTGEARERQRKQANAKGEELKQLLDSLYFQYAQNTDFETKELPPEPVYKGISKPSGYLRRPGLLIVVLGVLISAVGIAFNRVLILPGMFVMIVAVFLNYFIDSINDKRESEWKRYEKEYNEYAAQYAEWAKLKEEYELRKRVSDEKLRRFM